MRDIRAPHRYAKALLSIGLEHAKADALEDQMKLIVSTIDENPELNVALNSPVVSGAAKLSILKDLFASHVDGLVVGLFNVLVENKRLPLLRDIAAQFAVIYDHHRSIDLAVVTTAVPLTKELESKVLAKVKELTGKETAIENVVDQDILGGFILRIGDLQYDASISSQLNSLRREFDTSDFEAKI